MIVANGVLKIILQGIINDEKHAQGEWIPATSKILRAFAYCETVHI